MVAIKGGRFLMGSERFYPEERPRKVVEVASFFIQQHEVTNAQFAAFVKSTNYVTVAERNLDAKQFPKLSEEQLKAGSLVFRQPLKVRA
jgi:formylglycine-generating enzyme required for sulfatase activity